MGTDRSRSQGIYLRNSSGVQETSVKEHLTNFAMVTHGNKPKTTPKTTKAYNIKKKQQQNHTCFNIYIYKKTENAGSSKKTKTIKQTKN